MTLAKSVCACSHGVCDTRALVQGCFNVVSFDFAILIMDLTAMFAYLIFKFVFRVIFHDSCLCIVTDPYYFLYSSRATRGAR